MKITRIALTAYVFALLIIVLDQLSKAWVLGLADASSIHQIPMGYVFAEILPPYLRFTFVQNTGVSFGLFGGGEARWVLSVFSVLVSIALGVWALKADRKLLLAAIGMVMGGAIGNVIDRIRFGYVVDFIDFSGTGVFPWVFNIADSAISIGVVLLILDSILSERAAKVGAAPEKS